MKTIDFIYGSEKEALKLEKRSASEFEMLLKGQTHALECLDWSPPHFSIRLANGIVSGLFFRGDGFVDVKLPEGSYRIALPKTKRKTQASNTDHSEALQAPMPGKVIQILVANQTLVQKGETLLVLEAMKMEHKIVAPYAGKVSALFFSTGDRVSQGEILAKIDPISDAIALKEEPQ